jgi:alpha-L-fucosidase
MTWFDGARFGMFIHWGHSSQQGIELSWPLVGPIFALPQSTPISVEQYHSSAATFDPQGFDPREWARMAKAAGMQYAVLTTKHHDGFAMWDTKTSDFSVLNSPYRRDIVRQYADAFREEGLRVGFYFSLADWHHPDYPAFTQDDVPYQFPRGKALDPERWPKFVDVMFEQVRELLTNYGEVACIWFDGGWERTIDQWRARDLEKMIRELQPGILINDRLPGSGDYLTPEQFVPPQPLERPWETCMTMNESWGYNPADTRYKSSRTLIHRICEIAGRGGNLLLNVSPRGDGTLPPEQVERIEAIGSWMGKHGQSIVGTTAGLEPWQFYGPSTRQGDTVYLHLLMRPYDSVTVRGVRVKRLRSARVLGKGGDLKWFPRTSIADLFANADPLGEITIKVPEALLDPDCTVIALDFAEGPLSA